MRRSVRTARGGGEPGVLVTLPSGIQYRELDEARATENRAEGRHALRAVHRTAWPRARGKYSSGGTPIHVGAWVRHGGPGGCRRDVQVRARRAKRAPARRCAGGARHARGPGGGSGASRARWVSGDVNPKPPTFGAGRRLANHREEPLLMEVDLVRVRKSTSRSRRRTCGTSSRRESGAGSSSRRRRDSRSSSQ